MGRAEEAEAAFLNIYRSDAWGMASDIEPDPDNVAKYVQLVDDFIRQNGIRSVVEFGCSAWPHLHRVDWTGIEYDGFDVIASLVEVATRRHGAGNIRFHVFTDETELPAADLLVCKDVFQHLPCEDIKYYLGRFKALYKYMLITDDVFPDTETNQDIAHGGYRAIRLDLEPFNQRCAVLQRLEGVTFGARWVKHTSLLFGATGVVPALPSAPADPEKPAARQLLQRLAGVLGRA
jgi:hypothetical protein